MIKTVQISGLCFQTVLNSNTLCQLDCYHSSLSCPHLCLDYYHSFLPGLPSSMPSHPQTYCSNSSQSRLCVCSTSFEFVCVEIHSFWSTVLWVWQYTQFCRCRQNQDTPLTPPHSLVLPPCILPLPLSPLKSSCPYSFRFSRMSYNWNPTVGGRGSRPWRIYMWSF